jgi:hypothetical protein
MNVRIERPGTDTDRAVQVLVVVTIAITAIAVAFLARAALAQRPGYRTVRVDNQTRLALQVDVVDDTGATMGLGEAGPRSLTAFQEVAEPRGAWTLVASYGGQEVARQTLTRAELAARGWTVEVAAPATAGLERAGFR